MPIHGDAILNLPTYAIVAGLKKRPDKWVNFMQSKHEYNTVIGFCCFHCFIWTLGICCMESLIYAAIKLTEILYI